MKKTLLATGIAIVMSMGMIACSGGETENTEQTSGEDAAAAKYACPMKCEGDKTYSDPDTKCPTCGMALTKVE